jgi:hypothetical protein
MNGLTASMSLNQALGNESDTRVWQWLCDHLPKFARLIPARRREQFIAGIREAFDEGDIGV